MTTRPSLTQVAADLAACTACPLRAGCKAPVMGRGNTYAKIASVGPLKTKRARRTLQVVEAEPMDGDDDAPNF